MKKILIINDHHVAMGGADRMALQLKDNLIKQKNQVKLFTYNDICPNYYKNTWTNMFKNIFNYKVYFQLRRELKEYCPDIIVIHSWTKKLSSSCFLACRGYDTKIVAHDYFLMCPNGGQFNYVSKKKCECTGGSLRCALTSCDKNNYFQKIYRFIRFCIQTQTLKILKPKVICLNQIQIKLLSKGKFKNTCVPNNISYMDGGFNADIGDKVLFIGRPDPEKGLDRVLKIATKYSYPLDLVGVNNDDIDLAASSNINCLGWIDVDSVSKRLEHARLLVFPSRWLEVDPLVPLEACARGVPVFCSVDNVFATTLERYGLNKYIFENSDDLIHRLEYIYADAGKTSTKKMFYELFNSERSHREELSYHEYFN